MPLGRAFLFVAVVGWGSSSAAHPGGELAERMWCARCHAAPDHTPPLCVDQDDCGPPLAALGRMSTRAQLTRAIRGTAVGAGARGEMPSYAHLLSQEEAGQISDWMAGLATGNPDALSPAWQRWQRLTQRCAHQDLQACVAVARLEDQGIAGVRRAAHAAELFIEACRAGIEEGCEGMRQMLLAKETEQVEGAGVKVACASGGAAACRALALAYAKGGEQVAKDPELAAKTYRRARSLYETGCRRGEAAACVGSAQLLSSALGGARDDHKAARRFERACTLGSAVGCLRLGTRASYQRACRAGNGEACAALAQRQSSAAGALALNERACADSSSDACSVAAAAYQSGAGTAADLGKANQLYLRACSLGSARGCLHLAQPIGE